MDEITLINECLKDNRIAQEQLYKRFASRMLGVCFRYARSRDEAEDLLQDAFIKVFDHIQSFEGKGSFEGWIRRIVVNTALKNVSRHSFQKEGIGLEGIQESSEDPSVFSQLSEQELLGLISSLPNGYRICFNLYVIEGFSHREIGEMLHIEESTSRSQLVKARNMLQNMVLKSQKITL